MTFEHPIVIAVNAALANNLLLHHLFGIDTTINASRHLRGALVYGISNAALILSATVMFWLISHFVLIPMHLTAVSVLISLITAAALTFAIAPLVCSARYLGPLGQPAWLLLTLSNSAILASLITTQHHAADDMLLQAFGSAGGFLFAMVMFTLIRARLDETPTPALLKGLPLELTALGIISMVLSGLLIGSA